MTDAPSGRNPRLQRAPAHTGAVTLIQRFGSAANVNIHLHCLVLDGVYGSSAGEPFFHEAHAPSMAELEALLNRRFLFPMPAIVERCGSQHVTGAQMLLGDSSLTPVRF